VPLDAPDDYALRIAELGDGGDYSAALRIAEEGAARYPDNGDRRVEYGDMLWVLVFDLRGARVELEAAARLTPDAAGPHHSLAIIAQLEGKDDEALAHARRALAIDADMTEVADLVGELEISARVRAGESREFEAGSPAMAVHRCVELIRKGEVRAALDQYIHPDIIDAGMGILDGSGERDRKRFMSAMVAGVREAMSDSDQSIDLLLDRTDLDGDEAVVVGYWLETSADNREEAAALLAMADSPELAEHLPPEMVDVFRGLDAADRQRRVDNMSGQVTTALQEVFFEMRRHQGKWRIADMTFDLGGTRIGISTFIEKMPAFYKVMGKEMPTSDKGLAYRLGRIVVIALVVMVIAAVIRRVVVKD
jgi:hypothetical protein